jgi:hypothetical protein
MKKVPILILTFNRPEHTMKVLEIVKKYEPLELFIASDGYRAGNNDEKERVLNLREQMVEFVDWDCELETKFSNHNLGCKMGVSSAINWFFQHVEFGVILEDDIIPNLEFFDFCNEMSNKYSNNERVFSICGYNALPYINSKDSYYFSKYFSSWGWATWSHKWSKIDLNFEKFKNLEGKELKTMYPLLFEHKIRLKKINDAIKGKNNSWASPWNFTHQLYNAYVIVPKKNQIKNIGFSNEFSTHTQENFIDKFYMDLEVHKMNSPIIHPKKVKEKQILTQYFIFKELTRILLKKIFIK